MPNKYELRERERLGLPDSTWQGLVIVLAQRIEKLEKRLELLEKGTPNNDQRNSTRVPLQ